MEYATLPRCRDPAGPFPPGPVGEHQPSLLGTLGSGEEIPQCSIAAQLAQASTLRPRLDAFRDDPDAVCVRELDDRRHDAVPLEV